jgi:hypothetical protein
MLYQKNREKNTLLCYSNLRHMELPKNTLFRVFFMKIGHFLK